MDAPLGSVGLEESDELQRLRRRAYGPDADIAGDAAAQARLSELEAAQHRQPASVVDAPAGVPAPLPDRIPGPEPAEAADSAATSVPQRVDRAFVDHEPGGLSATAQDHAEGPAADSRPTAGGPTAPWWRRRRWLVILGGGIAVLALNAALVGWMSQLLAQGAAPLPADTSTATMPPVPNQFPQGLYLPAPDYVLTLGSVGAAADRPNDPHDTLDSLGISRDELSRYEDFQRHPDVWRLNVWSGESRYGMTCLFVAVPEQGIRGGNSAEGCAPEGFHAIAELRQMEGDGFTRFVLRGDEVNIYVYAAGY